MPGSPLSSPFLSHHFPFSRLYFLRLVTSPGHPCPFPSPLSPRPHSFFPAFSLPPYHTTQQRRPPPAFATTSIETINFSIRFGFAALIHVSLDIFREFYVDFVDTHPGIRVFTRFRLPHHVKCCPNIANSMPHAPKTLGTRSELLWTL
jgi:hypothetical protein